MSYKIPAYHPAYQKCVVTWTTEPTLDPQYKKYFSSWVYDHYRGIVNYSRGRDSYLEFESEEDATIFVLKNS